MIMPVSASFGLSKGQLAWDGEILQIRQEVGPQGQQVAVSSTPQAVKPSEVKIDKYWTRDRIQEVIDNSEHPSTIQKLVECESRYVSIKKLDSNHYYSYGILQYQSSTWNGWSKESGIKGDPMNAADAVKMADWAIDQGNGHHWTCWRIQGLDKKIVVE